MDGVKVTYIETRFVTSDAAGFKDLVQRLTGRSPASDKPAPAAPPRAAGCGRSAAAAAGTQGCYHAPSSPPTARAGDCRLAPPGLDEAYGGGDFAADLLYGGSASQDAQYGHGGYYSFSDYFPC
ncbi:hypothetical protein C2845_PM11G18930 [Panicum miliaceum]|uniref:VQ domain-containing protein n=1 Tax=Panicum miliaceum TaxID=4540 RepID=A0A3L6RU06_PANMI|nr:hypothetical protein C2845_PM11G18930 [Panicum miliaceum]